MALYPHLPSPTTSIPWQDLGSASRPLFRLRGVQPWETKVGYRETAHVEQNIEDLPFIPLSDQQEMTTAVKGFDSTSGEDKGESGRMVARYVEQGIVVLIGLLTHWSGSDISCTQNQAQGIYYRHP